ncbi:MAG: hypothetical protein ACK4Y0_07460 [Bacteroidota bacterium]
MEVHHPHHPTHKKKWSEYIIEFLMLFAAVTLGFFAENQREHYVEGHREIQFMESLMDDLAKDKIEVNSAREYTTTQISNLDTAISLLSKNNWTSENIKIFYRVSLKTGGNRPMTFIDKTSSQLKSGGMRLIRDKEVSRLITEYWQLIAQLNEFETQTIFMYKANIKNMAYKIIDGTKYIDVKNKIIGDDAQLMTSDRIFLAEYNNRLINLRFDLNKFLIEFAYTRLDKKINELQTEIAIKYNLGYKIN